MKITDGISKAFRRYEPGYHLLISAGSTAFVWYDGEWHLRPGHGLVGAAVPREGVLDHLREYGGHIVVERPPPRESMKADPEGWSKVYLVRVMAGGEVHEMDTCRRL